MANNYQRVLVLITSAGLMSACSTIGKSTAAGAGVGAGVGGIAGSFLPGDSKPANIFIGAAAGATLGGDVPRGKWTHS